jgi:hypothetical protein
VFDVNTLLSRLANNPCGGHRVRFIEIVTTKGAKDRNGFLGQEVFFHERCEQLLRGRPRRRRDAVESSVRGGGVRGYTDVTERQKTTSAAISGRFWRFIDLKGWNNSEGGI